VVDLLALLDIVVADGAHLLVALGLQFLDLLELLLGDAFGDLADFFLELEQFFVGHVIGIDFDAVLVAHADHHVPEVFHIHHPDLLVYISSE